MLVMYNDFYQLDDLTDSIWLGCEDGLDVERLTMKLVHELELPLDQALAATVTTLVRLESRGLIEIADGDR